METASTGPAGTRGPIGTPATAGGKHITEHDA
ncbi:hypothetical protein SMD11_5074 [Streptomyces albireticuli]|uniref:Uncharacterized protein n=1 Tax=Streptomyces albireticuli TaxID=1940 RepID=A0A1Z2L8P7_9ACTN|nr:hypothetical protein SMD11_5074 [Streptomyces albireticuli]